MAENTTKKQRGKPFEKGQSGNPAGRPKGSRNKATLAALELLEGEAEALTRAVIEKAKEGDMQALSFCLSRLLPTKLDTPLPEMDLPLDDPKKSAIIILDSMLRGEISTENGNKFIALLAQKREMTQLFNEWSFP